MYYIILRTLEDKPSNPKTSHSDFHNDETLQWESYLISIQDEPWLAQSNRIPSSKTTIPTYSTLFHQAFPLVSSQSI